MKINPETFDIEVSSKDYGLPIIFELDKGFQVGDKIIFCFEKYLNDDDFSFTVDQDLNDISFVITKTQAELIKNVPKIKYSIKHYRNNVFLDSLENDFGESMFNLIIKGAVPYHGET